MDKPYYEKNIAVLKQMEVKKHRKKKITKPKNFTSYSETTYLYIHLTLKLIA